jgi:hypothetical protein
MLMVEARPGLSRMTREAECKFGGLTRGKRCVKWIRRVWRRFESLSSRGGPCGATGFYEKSEHNKTHISANTQRIGPDTDPNVEAPTVSVTVASARRMIMSTKHRSTCSQSQSVVSPIEPFCSYGRGTQAESFTPKRRKYVMGGGR